MKSRRTDFLRITCLVSEALFRAYFMCDSEKYSTQEISLKS